MQVSGVKECCLCRMEAYEAGYCGELTSKGLHQHHVIYGRGRRALSDRFGLWVWLCADHHELGPSAVHSKSEKGREYNLMLKRNAQKRFEEIYGHVKWMEVFQKNYLG